MKSSIWKEKRLGVFLSAALFAGLFISSSAHALGDRWTSVASAGEADEADAQEISYSSGVAGISAGAPASSSVLLRYNVTSTADLNDGGVNLGIRARFRDNGDAARVIVRLRRYSLVNGFGSTLLTLDSNNFAASNAFQTQTVHDGCANVLDLDFLNNAYYIEATLTRTTTSGLPSLGILQVFDNDIC